MELKDLSTERLIEELEKRENIKSYDVGLYATYGIKITRKFVMPDEKEVQTIHAKKVLLINR